MDRQIDQRFQVDSRLLSCQCDTEWPLGVDWECIGEVLSICKDTICLFSFSLGFHDYFSGGDLIGNLTNQTGKDIFSVLDGRILEIAHSEFAPTVFQYSYSHCFSASTLSRKLSKKGTRLKSILLNAAVFP